jgi:hypothetical protein
LKAFRFRIEIDPHTIDFKPNVFSSRWENVEKLLARTHLVAFTGSGSKDVTKDARAIIQAKMQADPAFGSALRWNIQARPGNEVWAVLQALPKSAGFLRRDGRYSEDGCAAIELAAFRLTTPVNPEGPCRGPIPTLFSRDVEKAKTALSTKPETLQPGNLTEPKDSLITGLLIFKFYTK